MTTMAFEYATNESTGTVHLSNPGSLWTRTLCGRSVVDLQPGDETLHGNNATCAVCLAGRERHTFDDEFFGRPTRADELTVGMWTAQHGQVFATRRVSARRVAVQCESEWITFAGSTLVDVI